MLAQRLRHTVSLQSQSTSLDAYGSNTGTWSDYATNVRAGIEPISGTESLKAGQNAAQKMVRIVIRYRSDVTDQHRVLHGATIYQIVSVADRDTAHRWLELMCTEGGTS